MAPSEDKIFTVTAITRAIRFTLEETFPSVLVEGEVSNYLHHSSGHRYLSLKDENASLKVTVWRSAGQYLKFEPEDGMKVRVFGDITVYEKGGSYQLNARKILPVGVGELEVAFRQLYEKLQKEGLFEPSRKKPLPEYPLKVGVVTSLTGAAIRDIIQIARRRNDSVQLVIYPALVQGDAAPLTLISGIEYFNTREDIDLIIIGRGGGSIEDLWAFNDESLVRTIADSKKPVVSAVGHEIDVTLSDLAADLRAPTPSAAAELVIWDKNEFLRYLAESLMTLRRLLSEMTSSRRERLAHLISRPVFIRPESAIREKEQTLDFLRRHLEGAGKLTLEKEKNRLSLVLSRLESLSPLAILSRGYAVIKSLPSGIPVKSVAGLKIDGLVETILKDGSAVAQIKEIK